MTGRLVAGMDLGSTGMKLLVSRRATARSWSSRRCRHPGAPVPAAPADLPPERAGRRRRAAARRRIPRSSRRSPTPPSRPSRSPGWARPAWSSTHEAKPVAPAFAWFDPRGAAQVAAFPAEVRDQFAGRTGPSARAAGVRRQARVPARPGPGARRPALAEPARVRRDDARRPRRAPSCRSPPAPGCSTRTPARRGPRCSPRSGSRRTFLPPLVTAGTDLGRIADGLPVRGRPAHRRGPRPPRRGRGRRPDPRRALPRLDGHGRSAAAGDRRAAGLRGQGPAGRAPHQRGPPRRAGQARARRRA